MPLEIQTYPVHQQTLLNQIQAIRRFDLGFNLSKPARIAISRQPPKNPSGQVVTVTSDPTKFSSQTAVRKTLNTHAYAENKPSWRQHTKHRVVDASVLIQGNGFGEVYQNSFPVNLTTSCGINFMGSSPYDEAVYLSKNKTLNGIAFYDTMKLQYLRWLHSQDAMGTEVLLMPLVGGGLYMKRVSNKNEGYKQLALALRDAAAEFNALNIREIIYVIPDKNGYHLAAFNESQNVFKNYQPTNASPILTLANIDLFEAAYELNALSYRIGLVNPGSDRTLGGAYTSTVKPNSDGNVALEETIFNLSNAAQVITAQANPHYQFKSFVKNLQAK